jgi:purine-nucleoside phosphorylase
MTSLMQHIQETLKFIRAKTDSKPNIGIILGTGLGGLVKEIKTEIVFDYRDIPYFPVSTVESHYGKLIFGTLSGKKIVAMQGRFHMYEGYDMKQITFPVRVMKFLGVRSLLVSNAAGALNPMFQKGDVMIISDHINLLGDNPLIGPNDERLGPRFPDMSEAYSKELITIAERAALDLKIRIQKGVYVAMPGPNLETKAEYRFLRTIGADAVGMSTVPEDIVAVHMGMSVLGISILTDECFPDSLKPASLEAILKVAKKSEPKMTAILKEVVRQMRN